MTRTNVDTGNKNRIATKWSVKDTGWYRCAQSRIVYTIREKRMLNTQQKVFRKQISTEHMIQRRVNNKHLVKQLSVCTVMHC